MKKLYKYCDSDGLNVLKERALRLPFIGDINDPFDNAPAFIFDNNYKRIKDRALAAFRRTNITQPKNFEDDLRNKIKNGSIREDFMRASFKYYQQVKDEDCLLCVTANPASFLMWSHYSQKHTGLMIEIDFEKLLTDKLGILMHPVMYSHERPQIDVLTDPDDQYAWQNQINKVISVKSVDWHYENEYRTVFSKSLLEEYETAGYSFKKQYNGKDKWCLRLNPKSIKSVAIGCKATDPLLANMFDLKNDSELAHMKIYHAELSKLDYEIQFKEVR